jgi:hypothetical protein
MSENLSGIFMTSGVNEEGVGFITVAAHGEHGTILLGQLTSNEVRQHALAYIESAEAADQDAAVWRCIRKLGLPDELAAAIIHELRESRET